MDNPEMPFGGLVCPQCGNRLELRTSFDGRSASAVDLVLQTNNKPINNTFSPENHDRQLTVEENDFRYFVELVCTVCSHACPICRTNNKNAVSRIINMDNRQYIRLSGTKSALNQTINRLKNDYIFLSEPVFYMSRDSEIYHVNIECQRRNEHEHYKKRI